MCLDWYLPLGGGGEFGRTPQINRLEGRDHWPRGFTMLLAGGQVRGATVIGATDPDGGRTVEDPRQVADVHATVLAALGIDPKHEELAPVPPDPAERWPADDRSAVDCS